MKFSQLLGATALFSTLVVTPAFAQSTGQSTTTSQSSDETDADEGQAGEVLVTGSRLRRPNDDSSVPITSVRPDELLATGSVSLGDALNDLPALRSTYSQSNSSRFIGTGGLNLLDLRGLGTSRTLTLVNGRRHVTASPGSFEVDTNTIPSDLLDRVDLVTGANSAVYGSDAIAGVVNFILKRDFDGLNIRAQSSITSRGDRGEYFVAGVAGKNFSEGRGNIAVALEFSRANKLRYTDRPDQTGAYSGGIGLYTVQNTTGEPASGDGIPDTAFLTGVRSNQFSSGGTALVSCPTVAAQNESAAAFANRRALVCTGFNDGVTTTSPLAYAFIFGPDGSLVRNDAAAGVTFDLRRLAGGTSVIGGLGSTFNETGYIYPQLERYSANLLSHYDFSDAFQVYLEAKYVRVNVVSEGSPTFASGTLPASASRTNPFLTPQATALLNQILAPAATSFTFVRNNVDFGGRQEVTKRETFRIVLSAQGALTDHLRYEVAGNYGQFDSYYETGGNVLLSAYTRASNAVLAPAGYTGNNFVLNSQGQRVVCGVNANADTTDDDANCYPLNLFGSGAPDARALNYALIRSFRKERATQTNATAYISGDTGGFFELPGGAIEFAVGGEYRRETASSVYDPIVSNPTRLTFLNSIAPFTPPALEVKEAYGEMRLPILKDIPFIRELSLEGSARYSDYNYGPKKPVFAWNAGGVWRPTRDLLLRASYGKAVRSPTLGDLFAANVQTFASLGDPCSQTNINNGPVVNGQSVRIANCAAAGVPTTFTYTNSSGQVVTVPFVNTATSTPAGAIRGNPDLLEETSKSFTAGIVYKPSYLRGVTASVSYYSMNVENVITSLGGATVVSLCYDNPSGIDNQYCRAVFRRPDGTFAGQAGISFGGDVVTYPNESIRPSFFQQPFNFARYFANGIDVDLSYEKRLGEGKRINIQGVVTYVLSRRNYTDVTNPDFATRLDGSLGDPTWSGNINVGLDLGMFDVNYVFRYIDRMTIGSYATQNSVQGRPPLNADAFPQVRYPAITYSNIRFGIEPNDKFRFYFGVDNMFDRGSPAISGLFGTGAGGAIYPPLGRSFYAGVAAKF
ncbi:TonB-dependent receptor [uncultured Sphingomonas sp.]|uniref:TonB-dependent receptor domain-containing protein n=1 Tax=uncultured Sphingomonas sp. TaxID=158754 RepID=UPI0025EB3417|nr:TonB-dependent receptor [uncultured Sphingomonas sp.]